MDFIGYIRVSTDKQRDNTSLEEQENAIKAYCTAYQLNLKKVFVEVASGKDTKSRPIFQRAIKALKLVDGIIAYKLDRIARNTRDVLTLIEDIIQPENKALVLLDLKIDTTTPIGKMILTVMAAVAALERDIIRERTQGGRKAKAQKGGYAYGAPKYGHMAEGKELVINEIEQRIVCEILACKRKGESLTAIARELNTQRIKTKYGKNWAAQTVKNVIRLWDRVR